jgi:hypothetical protein
MKEYFFKKLNTIENSIKLNTNKLINEARELNVKNITPLVEKLDELKRSRSMFTKDLCANCKVSEVIEIHKVLKLNKHEVQMHYKYDGNGITLNEKNHLITAFGYALNDIKIN